MNDANPSGSNAGNRHFADQTPVWAKPSSGESATHSDPALAALVQQLQGPESEVPVDSDRRALRELTEALVTGTSTEKQALNAIVVIWEQMKEYELRALERRHAIGLLLNADIWPGGSPHPMVNSRTFSDFYSRLSVEANDLPSMRFFAKQFPRFTEFTQQHPSATKWEEVQMILREIHMAQQLNKKRNKKR